MSPDDLVAQAEQRIGEVIADFGASYWLRAAVRAALSRDPVDAAIDARVLHELLQPWSEAILAVETASAPQPTLPLDDQTSTGSIADTPAPLSAVDPPHETKHRDGCNDGQTGDDRS